MRKVTWRRLDQSAKQLVVGQTTNQYEAKLPLSDSGVPGGLPPDAAAVGERVTSSAARRRRGHGRRRQTLQYTTA